MKLISMTDFVLEQNKGIEYYNDVNEKYLLFNKVSKYAELLKTPLNLGMFVPCDEDGNILKDRPEPKILAKGVISFTAQNIWDEKYNKAKDRVLFEGFEITKCLSGDEIPRVIKHKDQMCIPFHYKNDKWNKGAGSKIIEDLVGRNIELSDSAIKQLRLESKKALAETK